MQEAKAEISAMVKAVWAVADTLGRGDVLTWEVMEHVTGVARGTGSWGTVKKKVRRRMLRERSIAMRAVAGVGWKLLTHAEQVHVCAEDRQRRAHRQVRRGLAEVQSANPDELSFHDRQLRLMSLDRMTSERRQLGSSLIAFGKATRSETLPQRKLPEVTAASAKEQANP